jgi:hypothetical protein
MFILLFGEFLLLDVVWMYKEFSSTVKEKIFDNAGGRCEYCDKQLSFDNHTEGERGAWEAHHKWRDGPAVASNGMALCLDCHKTRTRYGKKVSKKRKTRKK